MATLFRVVVRRPNVVTSQSSAVGVFIEPVLDGISPLDEVGSLTMHFKCCLIYINLVEPDSIRVVAVLNHVKSQAAGSILHLAFGIVQNGF